MAKKLKPTSTIAELAAALRAKADELTDENYHSEAHMYETIADEIGEGSVGSVYDVVKLLIAHQWH